MVMHHVKNPGGKSKIVSAQFAMSVSTESRVTRTIDIGISAASENWSFVNENNENL